MHQSSPLADNETWTAQQCKDTREKLLGFRMSYTEKSVADSGIRSRLVAK